MNDQVGRITQLTVQRDLELHISDLQLAHADERCVRELVGPLHARVAVLEAAMRTLREEARKAVEWRSDQRIDAQWVMRTIDEALDGRGGEHG